MQKLYKINKIYTRVVRTLKYTFASIFVLAITVILLLQLPPVQNYLGQYVLRQLEQTIGTEIRVEKVRFGFFSVKVDGLVAFDQQNDTLVAADEFRMRYNAFALLINTLDLRHIYMSGGRVNLNRAPHENDFNYQYIIDAFSGEDTGSRSSSAMRVRPVVVELSDFRIGYDDFAGGTTFHQSVGHMRLRMRHVDLEEHIVHLAYLSLDRPHTALTILEAFPPDRPDVLPKTEAKAPVPSDTEALQWNQGKWLIGLDELLVQQGEFKLTNTLGTTGITPGFINWDDLLIDNLNLDLRKLVLSADTVTAQLDRLNLHEQSGFILDTLQARLALAPDRIVMDDLLLTTPRTHISRQLAFRFKGFDDFGKFEELVQMEADLTDARVHLGDINYFATGIPLNEDMYYISGQLSGRVNSLRGRDIQLRYGQLTRLEGDFTIYGLPDPNETYLDLNLTELVTNKRELEEMVPLIDLPPQFAQLGTMSFEGNFTGFFHNFVAFGNLNTAIGSIRSDLNMNLSPPSGIPTYKGNLHATNFNLGKWFGEPDIGRISFNGHLEGEGLSLEEINANFKGQISRFELAGYTHTNILFDGSMKKEFFSGEMMVNGQDLVFDFTGTVDFSGEVPVFDMYADIGMARLKPLGLVNEDYRIRTIVVANFKGTNIDDIVGQINLSQTELYSDRFYYIGDVELKAEEYELGKRIMLQSNLVDAMLDGNFNVSELAPTFMGFLSQYYPSVLHYSSAAAGDMDFVFSIDIKRSTTLIDHLMPGVKGLAGSSISGNFNSSAQRLIAFASIPEIRYQDYKAEGLEMEFRAGIDTLLFDIYSDSLFLAPELVVTQRISGHIANDNVNFNLEVYEDSVLSKLLASGNFRNYGDSLALRLISSELTIAGQEWYIDEANEIRYHNNNLYFTNIEMKSGDQTISVASEVNDNNETDLKVVIHQVEVENLFAIVQYYDYTITGIMDGEMSFNNVMGELSQIDGDIVVKDLVMEDVILGEFQTTLDVDLIQGIAKLDASLVARNGGNMQANGHFNYGNDGQIAFRVRTTETPLKVVEPFVDYLASNLGGTINGDIVLAGTMANPTMNGKLNIQDGQAMVNYLGSTYYFEPMNVDFTGKSIYIRDTRLRDRPGQNASLANMGGEINFRDFNNMTFEDFYVRTQKNFKFMDITKEQNDLFYGVAYGSGILLLNGPLDDLKVEISAKSDPNTRIFIPIDLSTSVSQYDFIEFIDKEGEAYTGTIPTYTGITMVMDLKVTPDAEIQIIFDEQTGEIIRGRGDGNLLMKVDRAGNFEMYGDFTIQDGDYLFRMQDLVSKRFVIEKGSTINWSGDPYNARLNLSAVYSRRVARYDLVADLAGQMDASQIRQLKRPVPVDLKMIMMGTLERPDISFEIDVPTAETEMGGYFTSRLRQVQSDENELNKQVFGLIVFNKFLPPTLGGDQQMGISVGNTLSEFVSNQINMYFSDWLGNYNMSVNVDYRSYDLGQDEADLRQELELELQKRIGRFSFNVGGNLDMGQRASTDNNLHGDFELEYSITEDGRIRVRGFRDTEYNIFEDGYRGKTGVGIFLRKDFNSFSELFSRTNRPSSEQAPTPPPLPELDEDLEAEKLLEQLRQETGSVPDE